MLLGIEAFIHNQECFQYLQRHWPGTVNPFDIKDVQANNFSRNK